MFRVGLQDELPDRLLCGDVSDGAKERETPAFPIDGVLTSREGHIVSVPAPALPDAEADELEAAQDAFGEVQLGVGELPRWVSPIVWDNLDDHVCRLPIWCSGAARVSLGREAAIRPQASERGPRG